MHADVARWIAFSGEFFVRRLVDKEGGGFESGKKVEMGTIRQEAKQEAADKEKQEASGEKDDKSDDDKPKDGKSEAEADSKPEEGESGSSGRKDESGDPSQDQPPNEDHDDIPRDPSLYELVIDNDSGTYRPKKELLPDLRDWLASPERLGALGRVTAVDGFDEGLKEAKKARAKMRKEGKGISGDSAGGKGMLRRGSSASDVGRKWTSPLNLVKVLPHPTGLGKGKEKEDS